MELQPVKCAPEESCETVQEVLRLTRIPAPSEIPF